MPTRAKSPLRREHCPPMKTHAGRAEVPLNIAKLLNHAVLEQAELLPNICPSRRLLRSYRPFFPFWTITESLQVYHLPRMKKTLVGRVLQLSFLVIAAFAIATAQAQSDQKLAGYFVVLLNHPPNAPQ